MADAKSKSADAKGKGKPAAEAKKAVAPVPPPTPKEILQRNFFLLDKYVDTRDRRFLLRVLRYTNFLRAHLPLAEIKAAVASYVTDKERQGQVTELVAAVAASRKEPVRSPPRLVMMGCDGALANPFRSTHARLFLSPAPFPPSPRAPSCPIPCHASITHLMVALAAVAACGSCHGQAFG